MFEAIEQLLTAYERGAFTRRQLLSALAVLGLGGGTSLSRKVDLSSTNPAVEFEFVTTDAKLAPGVYSVQLELAARDGEPVGDFMRITVPSEPTPLGEPILSRRSNSPGQQYTRTADLRFRKTESVRFELPTTSGEPVSARLLDTRGGALSVPTQVSSRPDSSGTFSWAVVDVPMTPLAPAYYAVEVKQGSATRVTAFRVIP